MMFHGLYVNFPTSQITKGFLGALFLYGMLTMPVYANDLFNLTLDSNPFSHSLCQKPYRGTSVRIKVAHHHDLGIHRIPGQQIPEDPVLARSKDYTQFITLSDLSNGALSDGTIAFRDNRAIIVTQAAPTGISRPAFMDQLPADQQELAHQALNTFLRLQTIIEAAIDTCRPYPPMVTYGTDDEIDRIEAGRLKFRQLSKSYNEHPALRHPLFLHETGLSDGFFDPEADRHRHVSYQALNPLVFYVAHRLTPP